MNSELRTNVSPVFMTRSQFESVMNRLGFTHVQSSAKHEFWQRNGDRQVECVVVPVPEAPLGPGVSVYRRGQVAEFITWFGRSLMINPVITASGSNAAAANALADDVRALGSTLQRVIGRWHAKTRKQAAE
jgi:hypothetical protein